MRILLLATYFPKPGNPLIGTWALDQAQGFRRTGSEIEVISLTPWVPPWPGQSGTLRAYASCPAKAVWDGLTVHYPRWPVYPTTRFEKGFRWYPERWLRLGWWFAARQVIARCRAFRPDVILAHHTSVSGWVALQLSTALGIPYFCQDHALWDLAICAENPRFRRLYEKVAGKSAGMLAVSRRMAGELQQLLPSARVAWLPNGAHPGLEPPLLPAGDRAPVAFSAGMFTAYKGFDVLLRAWKQVQRSHPSAQLRIAGDGPDRGKLQALRSELGLEASVQFLGYLPQDAVQREMAAARLFVLPSWNETFGVVFVEAAACKTPSIWATNAGIADVFSDGIHGLAVPPHDPAATADAIVSLLADPARATVLGNAARAEVEENLTWDAVALRAVAMMANPNPS